MVTIRKILAWWLRAAVLVVIADLLGGLPTACAADWPQWRGPNRDGISVEKSWTSQWPEKGPKALWKAKVSTGMSSCAIVGNRLYTMGFLLDKPGPGGKYEKDEEGRALGKDFVWCLDAGTGKMVWEHSYPAFGNETYSTPTVHDGRVYTLGRFGQLLCLDAASGRIVWNKNLVKDFGGKRPYYGYACSPLVVRDVLVVECGGKEALVLGLDAKTGQPRWKCGKGEAGFSSAVSYEFGGKTGLVLLTPAIALAVNAANGEELWRYPWKERKEGVSPCTTPIVYGDKVFLSGSGNDRMDVLLQMTGDKPKVVWQNEEMANYFQSCVLLDGYLYGTHSLDHTSKSASMRCVRFETGEVQWEKKGLGHAPLMAADGKLIIMEEQGNLIVAEATPKAFKELARAKVLDGQCWTCPVLCGGRLYCRNTGGDLVCLDVKGP